jgi:chromosome segregation ATPase
LENQEILEQFEKIETKVLGLVQACKTLDESNADLRRRIADLEAELREKSEAINNFNTEKGLIRSKIDSLLLKIEDVSGT